MRGFPEPTEAASYYFKYIEQIKNDDIQSVLETQLAEILPLLQGIDEEKSLYRYGPDKWSFRQVIGHINDAERLFLFRAFWFARGHEHPLPSFDENQSAVEARSDEFSWRSHLEELQASRQATVTFFRNLPAEAWMRRGIASDNPFTVRALAFIIAGHLAHHVAILQERYQ